MSVSRTKKQQHDDSDESYFTGHAGSDFTGSSFSDTQNSEDEEEVHSKWMLDGAKSIKKILKILRENVKYYKKLKREGWEVDEEGFSDGRGSLRRMNSAANITTTADPQC